MLSIDVTGEGHFVPLLYVYIQAAMEVGLQGTYSHIVWWWEGCSSERDFAAAGSGCGGGLFVPVSYARIPMGFSKQNDRGVRPTKQYA